MNEPQSDNLLMISLEHLSSVLRQASNSCAQREALAEEIAMMVRHHLGPTLTQRFMDGLTRLDTRAGRAALYGLREEVGNATWQSIENGADAITHRVSKLNRHLMFAISEASPAPEPQSPRVWASLTVGLTSRQFIANAKAPVISEGDAPLEALRATLQPMMSKRSEHFGDLTEKPYTALRLNDIQGIKLWAAQLRIPHQEAPEPQI